MIPIRVEVVDATGAVESFNGGLLYGLTGGWPLPRAVRLGTAAGATALAKTMAFAELSEAPAPPQPLSYRNGRGEG